MRFSLLLNPEVISPPFQIKFASSCTSEQAHALLAGILPPKYLVDQRKAAAKIAMESFQKALSINPNLKHEAAPLIEIVRSQL